MSQMPSSSAAKLSAPALILFAHGARDARWAEPFQRLQQQAQTQRPDALVRLAFLEFMQPSLPELVTELVAQNCYQISLVPVFLAQGGHVLRDLPAMLEKLQQQYPQIQVTVASAIGEDPEVMQAIAQYCVRSLPLA